MRDLAVTDGTHSVTLSFGSSYTVSSFAAAVADGHTGTLIKFAWQPVGPNALRHL
jgi:hypothetical protein